MGTFSPPLTPSGAHEGLLGRLGRLHVGPPAELAPAFVGTRASLKVAPFMLLTVAMFSVKYAPSSTAPSNTTSDRSAPSSEAPERSEPLKSAPSRLALKKRFPRKADFVKSTDWALQPEKSLPLPRP
ncbi:unnamed protein product [Prorocentrum cordatum]|uniref:Uncharacterized protein n=1 Tax=Prorocentrum cordatum TaxID=2364126 RepID=A0ABN9SG70_9DINO|nr:unnamed protein product [Polarella glacialis]